MKVLRKKAIIFLVLFIIGLFGVTLFITQQKNNKSNNELWIEDVEYMIRNLKLRHKKLYNTISEEAMREEIDKFKSNINNLSDIGKVMELRKIVAKIGDGGTWLVDSMSSNFFPIQLEIFDDGYYVISTSKDYKDILGKKLISIEGVYLDEVLSKMGDMVSHDNDIGLLVRNLEHFVVAEYLKEMAIIDDIHSATFTFESTTGERFQKVIDSYNQDTNNKDPFEWISMNKVFPDVSNMLYTKNPLQNYWYEYLEENNLIYFHYNLCREDPKKPMKDFLEEVKSFIIEHDVEKLVIDLRNNRGGNSELLMPFLDELTKNEKINKKGNIYVIIGTKTFASAILHTDYLLDNTEAITIGKPTGGKPNVFGHNNKYIKLPNSGLKIYYSTRYYKIMEEEYDSIYPDIEVTYTIDDYINGIDPVMEKILNMD